MHPATTSTNKNQLFPAVRHARFNFQKPPLHAAHYPHFLSAFDTREYKVRGEIAVVSENRERSGAAAAARLDNLDSALRLVDEIGGSIAAATARPSLRHDSDSTKPYGEDGRQESSETCMDAMERSLSAMARSLQKMHLVREQPPQTRHRHCSDRVHQPRQDPDDFVRDYLHREKMDMQNFEGKQYAGDIFTTRLIPKPYMFVKRMSSVSLREKTGLPA